MMSPELVPHKVHNVKKELWSESDSDDFSPGSPLTLTLSRKGRGK